MISKIKSWWSQNGLFGLSLFLLIFIPLFPKIPLLDAIPGYLVRIRIEDILVAFTGLFWLLSLIHKKIKPVNSHAIAIFSYALVGLASLLSAIFLLNSVPLQLLHIGKSSLHYLRYLEYFLLFFFMYDGINNLKQLKIALNALILTLLAVTLYGAGQIYLHWPLYSTMNREFSKGAKLYLTTNARVQSTFAGHYDLAAYLVLILPIIFSLFFYAKHKLLKALLLFIHLGGVWLLFASASKTAILAYLIGMLITLLIKLAQKPLLWQFTKKISFILLISGGLVALAAFGVFKNYTKQGLEALKNYPIINHNQTLTQTLNFIGNSTGLSSADPKKAKPTDVYIDVPDLVRVATISATGNKTTMIVERDRTWSANALKYGLSIGIRLDTLWPQAINGWISNPLLGKGYGTLNKQQNDEFTESDSTDNQYLRVLGETGLFGFMAFFGVILLMINSLRGHVKHSPSFLVKALSIGVIGGVSSLLVNSLIIDVFTASKVAFTTWAVLGLSIKAGDLSNPLLASKREKIRLTFLKNKLRYHWSFLIIFLIFFSLIHKQPFGENSLIQSFSFNPSDVKQVLVTRCFIMDQPKLNCFQKDQSLMNTTYSFYLIPFYLLYNHPAMFYFGNLLLAIATLIILYLTLQQLKLSKIFSTVLLLIYVTSPVVYHLPSSASALNLIILIIMIIAFKLVQHLQFRFNKALMKINNFSLNYQRQFLGIAVTYSLVTSILWQSPQTILANFRNTYQPIHFLSIRRANLIFNQALTTHMPQKDAILISTIDPGLYDIYGNHNYDIYTLTATSSPQDIKRLFDQYSQIFITNSQLNQTLLHNFNQLKKAFGIKLLEIDCSHLCNYYQLLKDQLTLPNQPISLNQQKNITPDDDQLSILIISQKLETNYLKPGNSTTEATARLNNYSALKPSFMFLMGDALEAPTAQYQSIFNTIFLDKTIFPIIYVPGNFKPNQAKAYPANYQMFVVGNSMFIAYDPSKIENGELIPSQRLLVFNALLQLEKHPEIKNVFFITHQANWLTSQPMFEQLTTITTTDFTTISSQFFNSELLPALTAIPDKNYYFIAGDLKSINKPALFYEQENNYTYVATSANLDANAIFLEIKINPDNNKVLFSAHEANSAIIPNLENYAVENWLKEINQYPKFYPKNE